MFKNKNKFVIALLCLAIFGFVFFSIGNEYLHSYIHNHENSQEQESCLFNKLQTQTFTIFSALGALFCLQFQPYVLKVYRIFITKIYQSLPNFRAPPVLI